MFCVIFDMDGTLLDTQKICIPAWDFAGEQQGFNELGVHIESVCGMNCAGWSEYLLERYPKLDIDRFNNDVRNYILQNQKIQFKPGAIELMNFLDNCNIKYAVASGSSRGSVEHHFNEVNSLERFSALVCGNDVENGKPAPDVFLLTAEKLGVEPECCFVFEDSKNGVLAGSRAGMKVFGIKDVAPFDNEAKEHMFMELDSLDEAIEIFKKYI